MEYYNNKIYYYCTNYQLINIYKVTISFIMWINVKKIRKKKDENSNNGEDGNPGMGGRAGANVEIMTYQEFTKDRLIEFAKIYDNMN